MILRESPRAALRCFASTSTALLIAAGLVAVRSQPVTASPPKPGSPLQVADDLDQIIQPRFVQNAGMFGLSRLVPFVNGHAIGFMGRFDVDTPAEKKLLSSADAANRDYVIAFLHCAHVPGHFVSPGVFQPTANDGKLSARPPFLTTLVVTHNPSSDMPLTSVRQSSDQSFMYGQVKDQFQQAAIQNLPKLQKGREAQATVAQWTLVMRPVRASINTCVNCHTGSKKGDTLGVMVYAVGNTVNGVPAQSQQVGLR
jgi:hypothetical protein